MKGKWRSLRTGRYVSAYWAKRHPKIAQQEQREVDRLMSERKRHEEQEESRSGTQRREDTPERSQRDEEEQEVKPEPVVVRLDALEMKGVG